MNKMINKLKLFFANEKTNILKYFLGLIGIVLVVLLSGAGFTSFGMSSKGKILLYASSFLFFGFLFLLKIKTSFFKEAFQKKKIPFPKPLSIAIILVIFFTVLSLIFNQNKADNINTYIAFLLIIVITFFILSTFDISFLSKVFRNTLFAILSVGIVFFLITYVSKTFFSYIYYVGDKTSYGTHLFISNDNLSGLTITYYFKIRFTSLFWEPSVLGTIVTLALILEVYSKKDKLTIIRVIVFILSIILSQSTAGFVFLPIVLVLFVVEKTYNIYFKATLIFLLVLFLAFFVVIPNNPILSFLKNTFPDIFGKIYSNHNSSFITRFVSFGKCFKVFLKNPLFGFGGVTAREEYFLIAGNLIDAETSTFGVVLASFGLGGLFYVLFVFAGIIFCKRIDSFAKMLLLVFLFLLSNIQCQNEILFVNIVYFIPLALTLLPKKMDERNKLVFSESYSSTKTVKDIILGKNDNGEISRNVLGSLLLKGIAIFIAFFTIPVYLRYFDYNNSTYGIWVAITSILSVITVFDFGMGNGLKNKLIKNISDKNDEMSKTYISTTYVMTAIVGAAVFLIFSILIFSLSDDILLNVFYNGQDKTTIDLLSFRIGVAIIILAIGSQFFMKNINYVLQAHQKNAITGIFMVITNASLMIFALIFANVIPLKYRIVVLASVYFVFLIAPLLIASLILYRGRYKEIAPSFKYVNFSQSKSVINSSFKFFAVQIGNLFLWSLNEFIILFTFSYQSALVTEYTEYYKLFSLLPTILGTVIQQPFWTAIAKADAESDKAKIKKYIITLAIITFGCIMANAILTLALPLVFDIWLGSSAPSITAGRTMAFLAYSLIFSTSVMLVIIMNAMTLFKMQIVSAILAIAIKIPVVVLTVHVLSIDVGWEIVMYANLICYLPIFLFGAIEIFNHLKKRGFVKDESAKHIKIRL